MAARFPTCLSGIGTFGRVRTDEREGRLMLAAARLLPDQLSIPYWADDLIWLLFRKT